MIKYSWLWHQDFLESILIFKAMAATTFSGPLHTQTTGSYWNPGLTQIQSIGEIKSTVLGKADPSCRGKLRTH